MDHLPLSFIIPLYNEEKRLEPRLTDSLNFLALKINQPFEIILVDDGSTDKTLSLLKRTRNKFTNLLIRIIGYDKNQGKGYAVQQGVGQARGQKMIICDADFSVDLNETFRFLSLLENHDVVVGSKKHALSDALSPQKIPRRILGRAFTKLSNLTLGLNYSDVTCGFKGFKAPAAKFLFAKQRRRRWSYDAEILFLAKRYHFRTFELPVKWWHVEGSKVSPLLDAGRSLRDLFLIRLDDRLGLYDRETWFLPTLPK